MEILSVGLNNAEHCNFYGYEVAVLQLNGTKIWNNNVEFIAETEGTPGLIYVPCTEDGYIQEEVDNPITQAGYAVFGQVDDSIFDYSLTSLKIPSEYNGLPVLAILPTTFSQEVPNLKEIIIGSNVKRLSDFQRVYEGMYGVTETTDYYNCFNFPSNAIKNSIYMYIPKTVIRIGSSTTITTSSILCGVGEHDATVYLNGDSIINLVSDTTQRSLVSGTGETILVFGEDATTTQISCNSQTTTGLTSYYTSLEGVEVIKFECKEPINITQNCFLAGVSNLTIDFNGKIKKILGAEAFIATGYTSFIFPKEIDEISGTDFFNDNKLTEVTFEHTNEDTLIIPENINFMYTKAASTKTIYTDKQVVVDYNWSLSNITPNFYHLDKTTIWEQLAVPTVELADSVLNISSVENAEYYKVFVDGKTLIETNNLSVDLTGHTIATGSHNITVKAYKEGYASSNTSTSVTYTV